MEHFQIGCENVRKSTEFTSNISVTFFSTLAKQNNYNNTWKRLLR